MSMSSFSTRPVASEAGPDKATAAASARAGQSPPANWAIASSGSQLSAARSSRLDGIGTLTASISLLMASECASKCGTINCWRRARARRRSRRYLSPFARGARCNPIMMLRSRTVSGRPPIPANATGQKHGKSTTWWLWPSLVGSARFTVPLRAYPAFSTFRRQLSSRANESACFHRTAAFLM
jgi:hypothetical protein